MRPIQIYWLLMGAALFPFVSFHPSFAQKKVLTLKGLKCTFQGHLLFKQQESGVIEIGRDFRSPKSGLIVPTGTRLYFYDITFKKVIEKSDEKLVSVSTIEKLILYFNAPGNIKRTDSYVFDTQCLEFSFLSNKWKMHERACRFYQKSKESRLITWMGEKPTLAVKGNEGLMCSSGEVRETIIH